MERLKKDGRMSRTWKDVNGCGRMRMDVEGWKDVGEGGECGRRTWAPEYGRIRKGVEQCEQVEGLGVEGCRKMWNDEAVEACVE